MKETNIIYASVVLELLWEILENSPFIVNRYRKNKEYANYTGDSIVNIIGKPKKLPDDLKGKFEKLSNNSIKISN